MKTDDPYIVLFDGECNFCDRSVQFIFHRDPRRKFRFASLQSEKGKALLKIYHLENLGMSTMVLIKNDKAYTKSGAALRIARHLSGLWPLLVVFLAVPPFIRNFFYDQVAKRRHKLVKEKCELPTPEFKARFL